MLNTVGRFIEKEKLILPGEKIIVGLSGGMDSMALLDVLTLLGYQCVGAHCNFHLRGEESDRDACFVKKWCKDIDIPFTSVDFDTYPYAADRKISIEMAARELRYTWFEIIRKQYGAHVVAVAHHKDDSVETVLLNLVRGTGIRGLTGISPRNGNIVRPLLCVTRDEIECYISDRHLPNVFDSTNKDDAFIRNALRIHVIPMLETLNPSVRDAVFRTSQHLSEVKKIYEVSMEKEKQMVFLDGKIDIQALRKTISPSSVMFEILTPFGFHPAVIEDAFQSLDATPGKVFYSDQYRLIRDRDFFLLDTVSTGNDARETYVIEKQPKTILLPIHLNISIEKSPVGIVKKRERLYADADKLSFPLELRKWQAGDWFIPFGMTGRKKLSDYFTDRKFSLKDKENAWVLAIGSEILWIVGERSNERYKVTEKTIHVFMAEFIDHT